MRSNINVKEHQKLAFPKSSNIFFLLCSSLFYFTCLCFIAVFFVVFLFFMLLESSSYVYPIQELQIEFTKDSTNLRLGNKGSGNTNTLQIINLKKYLFSKSWTIAHTGGLIQIQNQNIRNGCLWWILPASILITVGNRCF